MLNSTQLAAVDLNLLVLLDVMLRERHVGRAAAKLHLSPSAVSHSLARLRRLFEDPLFLRVPKGMLPSDRALSLAAPITDILSRVSGVIASATPFDPKTSTRRFSLGMPDAIATVLVPRLLARLRTGAPHLDLSVRHILPQSALSDLESSAIDVACTPLEATPARFVSKPLYTEGFVIAARRGHPLLQRPTLKRYAEAKHVLVSISGDAHGFVDQYLAGHGLARRVTLVVSNFMLALAAVAEGDLVAALPRGLAELHAARFDVLSVDAPFLLREDTLGVVSTRSALTDAGVAWLFETIQQAAASLPRPKRRTSRGGSNRKLVRE